jgi:hypothetical protein
MNEAFRRFSGRLAWLKIVRVCRNLGRAAAYENLPQRLNGSFDQYAREESTQPTADWSKLLEGNFGANTGIDPMTARKLCNSDNAEFRI